MPLGGFPLTLWIRKQLSEIMHFLPYLKPEIKAFSICSEGIVCNSEIVFSNTEGSAGDVIPVEDIIQGGSF